MRRWLPLILAALLAVTLLPGLSAVDALDERESRDMVTAYESTNHHDWLSPVYGHEPFFDKPLPGYALEAIAIRVLQRGWPAEQRATREVAVSRLVRALLAAGLALAVAQIGIQLFGVRAGWLAGIALATMAGLPLAARTDGVQVYTTLLTWLGLGRLLAVLAGRTRTRGATLVLGWLTLGAAANTGGILSALWPMGGLAAYFLLARRTSGWREVDPPAGLLIILGTCLPWYGLMTAIHGPAFGEAMALFPYAAGVRASWWIGPLLALSFAVVASFPWTPLLGTAIADTISRMRRLATTGITQGPLDLDQLDALLTKLAAHDVSDAGVAQTVVEMGLRRGVGANLGKCVSQSCTPKTCADLGFQCGLAGDGCGGMLDCGTCGPGQVCGASVPGLCGKGTCTPRSCAASPPTPGTSPGSESADQGGPIVDLGRRAGLTFDRFVPGYECLDGPADRLDRPHQVLGEVDAVDRHVVQVAGPGQFLVLPPTPTRLRQIQKPLAAEVARFAERSALQ